MAAFPTRGCALLAPLVLVAALAPSVGAASPARACTITGTSGRDVLHGTPGRDVICGRAGNDMIDAGSGKDVVRGGPGNDVIAGGRGNDILNGGTGTDRIFGQAGQDVLTGGPGQDIVDDDVLREAPHAGIFVKPTYTGFPDGTKIVWARTSANCTKSEENFNDEVPRRSTDYFHLFSSNPGSAGPFSACAYEQSWAWYNVKATAPDGRTQDVNLLITQVSSPSFVFWKYSAVCTPHSLDGSLGLTCDGGSDWAVPGPADTASLFIPITIGPFR
jgi:hypothetical protein